MNSKLITFFVILIIAPLMGGIYGALHDQLTYSICHEYYTKFKFYQFGFADSGNEALLPNPRMYVALVGFLATWWMGIPIGIILASVGLIFKDAHVMFRAGFNALLINISLAFFTGLIGLFYGKYKLAETGVNWQLPENLVDAKSFIAVGSMHNFSYLGGLVGLVGAIIYMLMARRFIKAIHTN